MRNRLIVVMAGLWIGYQGMAQESGPSPTSGLHWDAKAKTSKAEVGDRQAKFQFQLANESEKPITVRDVRTSCGCTVAKLPSKPWVLEPGESGEIEVTVNLLGRVGTVMKSVWVYTSEGLESLTVKVEMPQGKNPRSLAGLTDRQRNQLIALRDPQAIFRGNCASCHAKPAANKTGKELYEAVCAVCHEAPHRASMVPDLRKLDHPTSFEHWQMWIAHGQPGTLMPAFLKARGGILSQAQVDSLADFLTTTITEGNPMQLDLEDLFKPLEMELPGNETTSTASPSRAP